MLFYFVYALGRETPSVAGIINPGAEGFQKLFFGQEEIAIPVHSTYVYLLLLFFSVFVSLISSMCNMWMWVYFISVRLTGTIIFVRLYDLLKYRRFTHSIFSGCLYYKTELVEFCCLF